MTDSFDLWGASLCWAHEASEAATSSARADVHLSPGDVHVQREPQPQASQSELNILSTQDIINHEASFDCGGVSPQNCERQADSTSSRQAGKINLAKPEVVCSSAKTAGNPSLEDSLQGNPEVCRDETQLNAAEIKHGTGAAPETLVYEVENAAFDREAACVVPGAAQETLVYEVENAAFDREAACVVPGAAQETLAYEVENAAFDREAACVVPGAAPETLVYEVENAAFDREAACVVPGAAPETLAYEVENAAFDREAACVVPGAAPETLAYEVSTPQLSSDTLFYPPFPVHNTSTSVSSVATPVRQGWQRASAEFRRYGRWRSQPQKKPPKQSKMPKPGSSQHASDEEASWLVPVKRRAEVASVKTEKKSRKDGMEMDRLDRPMISPSWTSRPSGKPRQLTLAEAFRGGQSLQCEVVEDSLAHSP